MTSQFREIISRTQKIRIQARLARTRQRMPIVFPAHERRQRHQNRFGAPARLQAEQSAAIVDQVELHVTTPPVELEGPFAFAERQILAAFQYRQIGAQKIIADATQQAERTLKTALVEVIEE